jgi:hypothetical protein
MAVSGRFGFLSPQNRDSTVQVFGNQEWVIVSDNPNLLKHPANGLELDRPSIQPTDNQQPIGSPGEQQNQNSISIIEFLKQDVWEPLVSLLTDDKPYSPNSVS